MSKFYLAASYASKDLMREHRDYLEAIGHHVTSRWIDSEETQPDADEAQHAGISDLEDIDSCWIVLLFTGVPSTTGGYHVEYGYAVAQGKVTIVIGPVTNIFQKQASYQFDGWNSFRRGYPL